MHRKAQFSVTLLACLALMLPLLGACGKSAPTRFYSLAAEAPEPEQKPAGPCYSLGIGPVDTPAYLDRTQIVTRGEGNRMLLAEFDQWIEPVQANFSRALTDALSRMVCARPVMGYPWPGGVRPDYQVAVQVRTFDGSLGKDALLHADWSIADKDGRVLAWKSSVLREPCAGIDHAALVAAQGRLVDRFAKEVAAALSSIAR
ncbi:PqiC family protein [Fundidesulfovibrio terrae]|uniref:PqiC family protein n=1 Tax=Fundidesulfovibrio terrae TaxID=2922866 RepID=UPI001FAF1BFE|nr:PqiC family protein [Fundidesulfovibrio terrae]